MPRRSVNRHDVPDRSRRPTLHADALFLLEPRRGRRDVRARASSGCTASSKESSRERPCIPGACHLYVHATESTVRPDAPRPARSSWDIDSRSEPHQSHAVTHVERGGAMGRLGARQPRRLALRLQSRHRRRLRHLPRAQPPHAAVRGLDGRTGRDRDQAGRTTRGASPATRCMRCSRGPLRRLRRSARREDAPERPIPAGMWDFAQGYAHLRSGSPTWPGSTSIASARARTRRRPSSATTPPAALLGPSRELLEGEILRDAHQIEAAMATFEPAVAHEDGLDYDEPEPLPFPAGTGWVRR